MMNSTEKEQLVKRYFEGEKVADLAKAFGVTQATAYNWIKLHTPIKRLAHLREITPENYHRLEREVKALRSEVDIFHRSGILKCVSLDNKICAIERMQSEFSVHMLCKTLGVLKSTYYHRKLRSPIKTKNELKDDVLRPLIKQIFIDSHERFGAPKIKFKLRQQGYVASKDHVSRLMKEVGLICKQTRLRYCSITSRKYKYYRNKLQCKFNAEAPNRIWVSDITFVNVKGTPYAICVVIDLYARKVVAYDVAEHATGEFVRNIFDKAFESRNSPSNLIFHSDQGTQYTSFGFRKHLRKLNVTQSFSNPGMPLDNAVAESFFSLMKKEELSHNYYNLVEELEHDVADYIDFFNNMRPHFKLGMLTPSEAESKFEQEDKD